MGEAGARIGVDAGVGATAPSAIRQVAIVPSAASSRIMALTDSLPTITAYSNDVMCYIPSLRVLKEGGYETRGLYSRGVGFFAPEAEKILVGKITELAAQVGRPR